MANIVRTKKRHRYIGFSLESDNSSVTKSVFIKEIRDKCRLILNKDCSKLNLRLIRLEGNYGIVKCNHLEKENVIKLLNSIKEIGDHKVKIHTIATSGTIHSLINKYFKNTSKIQKI